MATITFTGRVARTPHYIKGTDTKKSVVFFDVMENHRELVNGEWRDSKMPTAWPVKLFGRQADRAAAMLDKGDLVDVVGESKTEPSKEGPRLGVIASSVGLSLDVKEGEVLVDRSMRKSRATDIDDQYDEADTPPAGN